MNRLNPHTDTRFNFNPLFVFFFFFLSPLKSNPYFCTQSYIPFKNQVVSDLEYLQQTVIYLIALATCVYILAQHCKKKRKKKKKTNCISHHRSTCWIYSRVRRGSDFTQRTEKKFKKKIRDTTKPIQARGAAGFERCRWCNNGAPVLNGSRVA